MLENICLSDFPNDCGVYYFIYNNEVIYAGSSKNLRVRMRQHRSNIMAGGSHSGMSKKDFYKFLQQNEFQVRFELTTEYLQKEQSLIEKYKPIFNEKIAFTGLEKNDYIKDYRESHRKEIKVYNKTYYELNKEERKAYAKSYYETHKEELRAYYDLHKEEHSAAWKTWYKEHKEERATYREAYYESNKEELLARKKAYRNQKCLYNGEILTLGALETRFKRRGIPRPTQEAKKYLI